MSTSEGAKKAILKGKQPMDEGESGGGRIPIPRYDGTGDYLEWKRKAQLALGELEEENVSATRRVRRLLLAIEGPLYWTVTQGQDGVGNIASTRTVFARIEESRGVTVDANKAAAALDQLYQGKKEFGEFLGTFLQWSAQAGYDAGRQKELLVAKLNRGTRDALGPVVLGKYTMEELIQMAQQAADQASRRQ